MDLSFEAVEEALFAEAVCLKDTKQSKIRSKFDKLNYKSSETLTVFDRFTFARATLQRLQLTTGIMIEKVGVF